MTRCECPQDLRVLAPVLLCCGATDTALICCSTLAALRVQIEMGDHDPVETPKRLKPVLGSYVPGSVRSSQPAKEWLSDICEIHSRMDGFDTQACRDNVVRLCLGQHLFGPPNLAPRPPPPLVIRPHPVTLSR